MRCCSRSAPKTESRRPRSTCTASSLARRSTSDSLQALQPPQRASPSGSSVGSSPFSSGTDPIPLPGPRSTHSWRHCMPETLTSGQPLYARHARAAERGAWSIERDICWGEIDREQALAQPDILAKLRSAALIESFHPVNLSRLIRFAWDDIDAGVVFSLEMYEGFKPFHALRMYLDAVGYEPRITDDELRAIRQRADRGDLDPSDLVTPLVEFMLSEHLAAYFFRRLGEQAREPQLSAML